MKLKSPISAMMRAFTRCTAAVLCAHGIAVRAQTYQYYVATNGSDSAAGTSWETAFLTIQKAINTAAAGQSVAVSNGTYVLTASLSLNKGVTLTGIGGTANTIIDANYTGRILAMSDSAAVMDGFTLKNGKSASSMNGVGVNMTGGTLRNCTVCNCTNTAAVLGGGLYVAGASCLVTNCVISGNCIGAPKGTEAGQASKGGGIYISAGSVLSCVVSNNTASAYRDTSGQYGGGGLYVMGNVLVSNCTVSGNAAVCTDAQTRGGGIYVDGGTVVDCTVNNNNVGAWGGGRFSAGGGLYITNAALVERCVITRNSQSTYNNALQLGGGVYNAGGIVRNCQIAVNTNAGYGAGVYVAAGSVLDCGVSNNTVAANRTWNMGGGGFYVTGSGVASNCMISGNAVTCVDALTRGGGIFAAGGTVVACVVSNNSAMGYSSTSYTSGGGLYTTNDALVERCVITRNYLNNLWTASRYGAGAYSDGGTLRSCLIMGNTANTLGGGLYITAGTNENCTIVRNDCSGGNYGGVYWTNSPVIVNAVVYNNTGGTVNDILPVVGGLSQVTYSCSSALTNGTGNITADPLFVDAGSGCGTTFTAGDYRTVIGGPCAGTGLVAGWMSTALDLAGLSRQRGALVEMGAYTAVSPVSTFVAESGNDGNAGTSWSAPFRTIQKGINAATALATVSVSNGTYVLSSQLTVGKSCTVLGVNGSANTVIDANASGRIITIDHPNAVLDGFTLKNGRSSATSFNGTGVNMSGGVIRNCVISGCTNTYRYAKGIGVYMVTGTVDTCVIENNDGYGSLGGYGGGGIYMVNGLVTNTVLRSNRSLNYGGAIRMEGGLVTGCAVSNNTVSTGVGSGLDGWAHGGGIYLTAGTVRNSLLLQNTNWPYSSNPSYGGGVCAVGAGTTVSNCLITSNLLGLGPNNTPNAQGGGAYIAGGVLMNSQITNNLITAGWGSGKGGGAFVTAAGAVSNCTISANYASCTDAKTFGGGVYVDWGSVSDCVINDNRSAGYSTNTVTYGGGVYMTGTSLVERCVISRNYQVNLYTTYRYGAGVACDGGVMRSCLIMGNTANTAGGGLYITGGTNENCTIVRNACSGGNYGGVAWTNSPVILNAIVCNNTGGIENDILPVVAGLSQVTYSCAPSLTSGTGNITADPKFTASGSGSGTAFTAGDYRLAAGTPCYNKGLTESWMNTAKDLDLLPRVKNTLVDMGAYERQAASGTMIRIL